MKIAVSYSKVLHVLVLSTLFIASLHNICSNSIEQASARILFNSSQTEPSVAVEIITPVPGSMVSSTVNVSAIAQATNSVSKVEFYIDNQSKFNDSDPPYEWTWDTTQYAGTEHAITAKAYDTFGLENSTTITVIVDNILPTVSIIQPTRDSVHSKMMSIIATATDNQFVANVSVKFGDTAWTAMSFNITTGLWYYELNTTLFSDQQHILMVQAVDKAGNPNIAPLTTVFTDNNPPTITVQNPLNGATVYSEVNVTAHASDASGISKVEFYLQNALMFTAEQASYQWEWDTKAYTNGEYTITVKAFDMANHSRTSAVTVTVENVEPSWWQTNLWALLLASIIIVVLILAIVFYVKKK
jgi:hypothetical protein